MRGPGSRIGTRPEIRGGDSGPALRQLQGVPRGPARLARLASPRRTNANRRGNDDPYSPHLTPPPVQPSPSRVVAGVAGPAPSAQATFPGKPGPIAFQRFVDPKDEESSQIFSVARPGAKARKLTSGGNGFNPDYSPDGRRIVFERRFGGVSPDAIVTMGADGSSPVVVQTTCVADPCLGRQQPRLVARRRPGSCSSAPSGRSSRTRPRAASTSSPPTPTGAASELIPTSPGGQGAARRAVVAGRDAGSR